MPRGYPIKRHTPDDDASGEALLLLAVSIKAEIVEHEMACIHLTSRLVKLKARMTAEQLLEISPPRRRLPYEEL